MDFKLERICSFREYLDFLLREDSGGLVIFSRLGERVSFDANSSFDVEKFCLDKGFLFFGAGNWRGKSFIREVSFCDFLLGLRGVLLNVDNFDKINLENHILRLEQGLEYFDKVSLQGNFGASEDGDVLCFVRLLGIFGSEWGSCFGSDFDSIKVGFETLYNFSSLDLKGGFDEYLFAEFSGCGLKKRVLSSGVFFEGGLYRRIFSRGRFKIYDFETCDFADGVIAGSFREKVSKFLEYVRLIYF